jgi:hypothetical protein
MNQQSHQQQPSSQSQGSQQAPLSTPQPASVSLWCHSCGAENRPNASFCTNCGTRLMPAPQSQLSQAQPQGREHVPPRSQPSRPKNSRKMSTGERAALISATSAIVVALITAILGPIIISHFSGGGSTPTPNPTTSLTATSSLSPNVYPPVGWQLVLDDPMNTNNGNWAVSSIPASNGACRFIGNVYQVNTSKQDWFTYCPAERTDLTNFALEVQMIITKGDRGGIIFYYNASTKNFYYFWISHGGLYELDIYENNYFYKTLKQGSSVAIHTGLDQSNVIAMVAQGSTFQLFVNKQLIATVTDKESFFGHGDVGLTSYEDNNPTEVIYNNAKMWTPPNSTSSPHATSTPLPTVYPLVGWNLVYSDPMKSNSSGYWPVGPNASGSCTFTNGAYQVSAKSASGGYRCINTNTDFTNFAFEAQMTITKGDEEAILFRANADTGNYYEFWISPAGTYGIEIWENDSFSKSLGSDSSVALHSGLNQPNLIAVVAQGNTFQLFVNKQLIATLTDKESFFGHGSIGLDVDSINNPTEALFSNVKVWVPSS